MRLFGPVHAALLIGIAATAISLAIACRRGLFRCRNVALLFGYGLAVNEIVWWIFRYSREGFRFPENLPFQLCDVTVWSTVLACIRLTPWLVEFSYFAGLAGAGMAVITPDLWAPWPTYPAIYFFLAHGGIIVAVSVLVFGGTTPIRSGAVWRALGMLLIYAAFLAIFDAVFHTNYMYLCHKPKNETLLSALGAWPVYLVVTAVIAVGLFWLLWLPVRKRATRA